MGRRNTARRRLAGAGTGAGLIAVSSDPHLATSCPSRGFPPGTTVDELRWFSRRKVDNASYKPDNIFTESGSLKDITSEYTRCFRAPPIATHSLGDLTDEPKRPVAIRRFSSQSEDMTKNYRNSEPGLGSNRWHRPSREQNLKLEGEMLFKTENADEFIEYVLGKRPDLLRRQTQLKLEGEMDSMTESRDKYIPFENCRRPPLAKRNTNLHLEGDHSYAPEYRELFVEFPRKRPTVKRPNAWLRIDSDAKMNSDSETLSQFVDHLMTGSSLRSEILRRPSNLKCEGDLDFTAEYRDSYRQYPTTERQCVVKQMPSLRLEGQLYTTPEYRDKFTTFQHAREKPFRPFNEFHLGDENDPLADLMKVDVQATPLNLATESGINVSTDNTAITAKPPPTPPTKTLKSDSHKSNKPDHTGTSYKKYSPTIYTKTKPTTHSDTVLEDRLAAKPPRSSRTRTPSRASQSKRDHQFQRSETPKRHAEITFDTSTRQPNTSRWMRQPYSRPGDSLDENLESKPEYRKAYLDYLIREKLPNRNPIGPDEKNGNAESGVNPASKKSISEERKTGGNNNNLAIYQPTTRRASASSIHSSPRRRSASPSYKMQVTNVDEPKKGFGTKRHSPNREHSIDYITHGENFKNSNRSNWIKSIAQNNQDFDFRNKEYSSDNKSFVVLDNEREKIKTRKKWESPWWQSTYN